MPPRFPPSTMPDRDFAFCKLMYRSVRREELGMGWVTDYPYAGINLMIRFSELTTAQVSRDSRDEPNHWVVELTDKELFNCPIIMAADVGTIGLSGDEVTQLRNYLLKGGFLWVDDFWGTFAWQHWSSEIGRVLPPSEYPINDLPLDHPAFPASQLLALKGLWAGAADHLRFDPDQPLTADETRHRLEAAGMSTDLARPRTRGKLAQAIALKHFG